MNATQDNWFRRRYEPAPQMKPFQQYLDLTDRLRHNRTKRSFTKQSSPMYPVLVSEAQSLVKQINHLVRTQREGS